MRRLSIVSFILCGFYSQFHIIKPFQGAKYTRFSNLSCAYTVMRELLCSIKYEKDAILERKWTRNSLLFWTFLRGFKAFAKEYQRHLLVYLLKMSFAGKNPPWARPAGDGKWLDNTLVSYLNLASKWQVICMCRVYSFFVQLWKVYFVYSVCTKVR